MLPSNFLLNPEGSRCRLDDELSIQLESVVNTVFRQQIEFELDLLASIRIPFGFR